jgi:hypothetical protein
MHSRGGPNESEDPGRRKLVGITGGVIGSTGDWTSVAALQLALIEANGRQDPLELSPD